MWKKTRKRCSQYAKISKALLLLLCIYTRILQSLVLDLGCSIWWSPPIGRSVQKRSLSVAPAADEFTRDGGFTHRTSDERFFFFFFVRIRIALLTSSRRRRLPTERKRKQTLFLRLRGDVPDFIGDGDCFDAATRVTRAAAFPPRSAPGAIVARDFPRA